MKMKVVFYALLVTLLCVGGFAAEMRLKEKLSEASPGSYLVIEQNKIFTFFHIYGRSDNRIFLEEVSIPTAAFKRETMSWKGWFENGAPGHTAWMISQINLESGRFEETFSFTHQGWIDLSESNTFLTTLLNLRFRELSAAERKKVGSPPGHSKDDRRPFWAPRLIVDGKNIANIPFSAYIARWPSDHSELSRKIIEIYLPQSDESEQITYPTFFPFWLEVDGRLGSAKVRVIDSGLEAHSPKPGLPRRVPQLLGDLNREGDFFVIHLKSPLYYNQFVVMAKESQAFFGSTFPLPCEHRVDGENVDILVATKDFKKLALPDKSYILTLSPSENPSIVLETRAALQSSTL